MSVIRVKGRTTNSRRDFEDNSLSSNSLIYTDAKESELEEFSIELHLGRGWNEFYSPQNRNLIKIDDAVTIKQNRSIVVEVAEEVRVPCNQYGIVLPTGSLFLARGVLLTAAKVEPSFSGKLKVRLYNTSSNKVKISVGEKIGSIVFLSTQTTIAVPPIHRSSEVSELHQSRMRQLRRFVSENKIQIITWAIALIVTPASAIGTLFLTHKVYYGPMMEQAAYNSRAGQSTSRDGRDNTAGQGNPQGSESDESKPK